MLADTHGNVIVVGTRDCSLQRRFQKLVEEAPAPFLSDEQRAHDPRVGQGDLQGGRLPRRRHRRVPGRPGRADLVPRGQHPAAGRAPGVRGDLGARPGARAVPHRRGRGAQPARGPAAARTLDRVPDQRRGRRAATSCPRPAPSPRSRCPAGPGVRVDAGVEAGSVIGGQFDSLLAKLIVTGSDRAQALERSRRALAEFQVEGMATVLPFHRLVVADPAFAATDADGVHRAHPVDRDRVGQHGRAVRRRRGRATPRSAPRQTVVVEVGGRRLEVSLPGDLALGGGAGRRPPRRRRRASAAAARAARRCPGDAVTAPMQGTIIKVAVSDGDTVSAGDLVVVLEAMKMENPVTAHKDGTVTGLAAVHGQLGRPGHRHLRDQGLKHAGTRRDQRRPLVPARAALSTTGSTTGPRCWRPAATRRSVRWRHRPACRPRRRRRLRPAPGRRLGARRAAAPGPCAEPTTGEMLGEVELADLDLCHGTADVACWALPAARGRGMTTTALSAVLRFAFGGLGLHRLTYPWADGNTASGARCPEVRVPRSRAGSARRGSWTGAGWTCTSPVGWPRRVDDRRVDDRPHTGFNVSRRQVIPQRSRTVLDKCIADSSDVPV